MRVDAMMTRYLLAPLRCLFFVALAVAGFATFMLWVAACVTVVAYHPVGRLLRALARLQRALVGRWTGVAIATGARTTPEHERRTDGRYVHDK